MSMSNSNNIRSHFASFAAYTPPPDDPSYPGSTSRGSARAWFPSGAASGSQQPTSYQSGGIPTFNTSQAGGAGALEDAEAENVNNLWETRHGLRVDLLAASAYLLGPVSALTLLIVETYNDFVRFHAYQSALLTTPLVIMRILASLLQFSSFLRTIFTFLLIIPSYYMAWRAYVDASRNGLVRFQVPFIGPLAERWVYEE
ncbi:hypothetical protein BD309DRAFT_997743 [Dichomitus squalens]|uniref:Uncharacterized protein n=1 Tax=Dichomitus squalens TaxID=114155 RepID=A0A4Q9N8E1_9APHY|nr:hypothetical protein BD311DRAFT_860772 [Dichomitus squalens]TBU48343.1 hypothetical protein BD309DRAFT_997743 [Dichomitus squalens]